MGNRVHVVKVQREYGKSEAFNWKFEEFKDLLTSLGCNVCEQEEYSSDFEIICIVVLNLGYINLDGENHLFFSPLI